LVKGTLKTKKIIKVSEFRLQIPCHKHNLELIITDYIYRISYKIAKKGKSPKKDLPLEKRYHNH